MSASKENTAIFMTDDAKKIAKKIKSHAFSGGGATKEDHEKYGGNPDVDIAYQYLSFFEEDDAKMEKLASEYRKGTLSTREMKEACIEKLQEVVAEFQKVCLFPPFLAFSSLLGGPFRTMAKFFLSLEPSRRYRRSPSILPRPH